MGTENIKDKVVVAMSGGVDSSVAALLLKEQGYDLVGVSMQVWDYRQNGGCESKATCCAPDDFTDARMVSAKIGVPYYVFDFEDTFREKVINNFVDKYHQGFTPNPCIDCNNKVKFKELRERAMSFSCSAVATGHYAQVEKTERGMHLYRGVDATKDQSYFLYGLKQEELENTIFPVGHMTKPEVRDLAEKAGLLTAQKPESQDICFVSGSVQDFIVKIGGKGSAGNIVNRDGQILGVHDGIHAFTVGQRRGLGISTSEPYYVLEINKADNTVVVGSKEELERDSFKVSELNWISPDLLLQIEKKSYPICFEAIVQLRYRHSGVKVGVEIVDDDLCIVNFEDDWSTVSPGQAAVFYCLNNNEVLGGGRIEK